MSITTLAPATAGRTSALDEARAWADAQRAAGVTLPALDWAEIARPTALFMQDEDDWEV